MKVPTHLIFIELLKLNSGSDRLETKLAIENAYFKPLLSYNVPLKKQGIFSQLNKPEITDSKNKE